MDYSTYLGGSSFEATGGSVGIAVDREGDTYAVGTTSSADFPRVTLLQPTFGGGFSDGFVVKIRNVNPVGPLILAQTTTRRLGPVDRLRVLFDRTSAPESCTREDVFYFEGPLGLIRVTAISLVPDSDNRQFDVLFPPQTVTGLYALNVGPFIFDLAGNPMDQTPDGLSGWSDDYYLAMFGVEGPRVVRGTPAGMVGEPVERVRLSFNTPINPATFEPSDIYYWVGLRGPIERASVEPVSGSGDRQFDILPDHPLLMPGRYWLAVWPDVRDVWGNPMDQDNDLIGGEGIEDGYLAFFESVAA